jgi:hypothetical protein
MTRDSCMSAADGANDNRPRATIDETALARQAHGTWEKKAAFWDEMMGEGNAFQRVLIGPAAEQLLKVRPTETVLDVACDTIARHDFSCSTKVSSLSGV